jgi:hypothetical protein
MITLGGWIGIANRAGGVVRIVRGGRQRDLWPDRDAGQAAAALTT